MSYEAAFYGISCMLFFAAARRDRGRLRLLSLLAGLSASIGMLVYHPSAAYFLVGVGLFLIGRLFGVPGAAPRVPAYASALFLGIAFYSHANGWQAASLMLSVPFFATVVYETGWFAHLLRTRPLVYLGRVSYSLYLVPGVRQDRKPCCSGSNPLAASARCGDGSPHCS